MKIGFFSPYFDSTGGGERYVLTLASLLAKRHNVKIFWDDPDEIDRLTGMLSLKLPENCVVPNIFSEKNLFQRLRLTRSFDLIFALSDGSIPVSFARRTVIHFQAPFGKLQFPSWKKFLYHGVVVNSEFTKNHLDPYFGKSAVVIYPPVNVSDIVNNRKKNKIILSVGRFHPLKKQDVLIDSFLRENILPGKGYRLVLSGSAKPQDRDYLNRLKTKAAGKPVEIMTDLSYRKLINQYEEAEIYWHAAGYGETDPIRMEHFGIAPVEAMAAGCVVFVYQGGGLPEIVSDGVSGFIFKSSSELTQKTINYLNRPDKAGKLIPAIRNVALRFDVTVFEKEFFRFFGKVTGHEI